MVTTQPREINYRKFKVIAFVVNAIVNVAANTKERSFFVWSICFDWISVGFLYIFVISKSKKEICLPEVFALLD